MNICCQCDQTVEFHQITSHCVECSLSNAREDSDQRRLADAENSDLCEHNARLHSEVIQLQNENKRWIERNHKLTVENHNMHQLLHDAGI
jgi:hypothetical protein